MNEAERDTGESLQLHSVDLEQLPIMLTTASALSRSVLTALASTNPAVAQQILREDAEGVGRWVLQVKATAPAELALHWMVRGRDPQLVATGPGTRKAELAELEVFEGAQAFIQAALAEVSPQERVLLGTLMAEGRGYLRIKVSFGSAVIWAIHLHAVIYAGKGEGAWHIATQREGPHPGPLH
jgi:hypothetical protein